MAECINCGSETEPGSFFCPECLDSMAPGEEERQPQPPPPGGGKEPPPAARAGASAGDERPSGQAIDAVRASVLTPPGEKRVLKAATEPPQSKPGKGRSEAPRERPDAGERARAALGRAGRGGRRAAGALKGAAFKGGRWLKGLALQESVPLKGADLAAWAVGLGASLLLLASLTLMDLLEFAWMPKEPDAFEATFSRLKGFDLGLFGYLLIACAALILVVQASSLAAARYGWRTRLNPSFLAAALCLVALGLLPLALASNAAIVSASTARSRLPMEDLGYARKSVLYGAYIALFSMVAVFGAASSILAEEKAVPYWMASLYGRCRDGVKALAGKARGGGRGGPHG